MKSLRDKLTDRIVHEEESYKFTKSDDDETDLEETLSVSATSPTSVLKNKDDSGSNKSGEDDDCFCCSKQMVEEEEEEAYDDAFDNWDGFKDACNSFENEDKKGSAAALHETKTEQVPKPNTNQRRRKSSPAKIYHEDKQKPSPEKAIQKNRRKKNKSDQQQDCDEKTECPICSEEMDATDLSFLPCPCGFRLCLFCHKQINENDGRCPACRKKYETSSNSGEVSFQQRGRGTIRLSPSFRGLDRA